MATLNVKGMPDPLYRKLRTRAKQQRRSVAQEVIHLLAAAVEAPEPRSLLELRGLGRKSWTGIDPAQHIADERSAWR